MTRRTTVLLLVLLAGSHTLLALYGGLHDGDFSMLWLGLPFAALTLLAALVVGLWPRWQRSVVLVPLALAVFGAFLLVPIYGLGLLHLPQALLAVGLVTWAGSERGRAG